MNRKGITLLETLMVIALIALLTTSVVPNMASVFRAGTQSSLRRFSAMVRYTYDQAILTGKIHRIVIDMDEQKWLVQIGGESTLPIDELNSQAKGDYDFEPKPPSFDTISNRDTQYVPKGIKIAGVSSWRLGKDKLAEEGQVAIYAFPTGLMDEASVILQSQQSEQSFEASISPLTGRVNVEVLGDES